MRWVSFDEKQDGDLIICGEERYFVANVGEGRRAIVSTRCSHRGDPLHMGERVAGRSCIRCPWHKLQTPIKVLERRSLPSARIGSKWTTLLPGALPSSVIIVMPKPTTAV